VTEKSLQKPGKNYCAITQDLGLSRNDSAHVFPGLSFVRFFRVFPEFFPPAFVKKNRKKRQQKLIPLRQKAC
jgi:hypothetical protein